MPDIYLGTKILDEDTYIDEAGTTIRLHPNGDVMEKQILIDGEWVTQQTWGS